MHARDAQVLQLVPLRVRQPHPLRRVERGSIRGGAPLSLARRRTDGGSLLLRRVSAHAQSILHAEKSGDRLHEHDGRVLRRDLPVPGRRQHRGRSERSVRSQRKIRSLFFTNSSVSQLGHSLLVDIRLQRRDRCPHTEKCRVSKEVRRHHSNNNNNNQQQQQQHLSSHTKQSGQISSTFDADINTGFRDSSSRSHCRKQLGRHDCVQILRKGSFRLHETVDDIQYFIPGEFWAEFLYPDVQFSQLQNDYEENVQMLEESAFTHRGRWGVHSVCRCCAIR